MPPDAKANYGIDTPGRAFAFGMVGVALSFVGIFVGSATSVLAGVPAWVASVVFLVLCVAMIVTSKVLKPRLWRRELDRLQLAGTEQALDAGCGRGLVSVELA